MERVYTTKQNHAEQKVKGRRRRIGEIPAELKKELSKMAKNDRLKTSISVGIIVAQIINNI